MNDDYKSDGKGDPGQVPGVTQVALHKLNKMNVLAMECIDTLDGLFGYLFNVSALPPSPPTDMHVGSGATAVSRGGATQEIEAEMSALTERLDRTLAIAIQLRARL